MCNKYSDEIIELKIQNRIYENYTRKLCTLMCVTDKNFQTYREEIKCQISFLNEDNRK